MQSSGNPVPYISNCLYKQDLTKAVTASYLNKNSTRSNDARKDIHPIKKNRDL